jgi:hypothetical protein
LTIRQKPISNNQVWYADRLARLRFSQTIGYHKLHLACPGLKRPTHQFGVRDFVFH